MWKFLKKLKKLKLRDVMDAVLTVWAALEEKKEKPDV